MSAVPKFVFSISALFATTVLLFGLLQAKITIMAKADKMRNFINDALIDYLLLTAIQLFLKSFISLSVKP